MNTKPCPKCAEPVGTHTVDQLEACCAPLYNFDLPFEETPRHEQDVEMVLCSSVVIKAAVHNSPLGVLPLLLFEFSGSGGVLPSLGLLLDDARMRSLKSSVAAAIDAAIREANKRR